MKDRSNAELITFISAWPVSREAKEALAEIENRLTRLDAFGQLMNDADKHSTPIDALRRAVKAIWLRVDSLSAPPDPGRRVDALDTLRRYRTDRARIFGAAILRGVALGSNYGDVAGLCSSYDEGLAILKEHTE
jgi:hypothetical protein